MFARGLMHRGTGTALPALEGASLTQRVARGAGHYTPELLGAGALGTAGAGGLALGAGASEIQRPSAGLGQIGAGLKNLF